MSTLEHSMKCVDWREIGNTMDLEMGSICKGKLGKGSILKVQMGNSALSKELAGSFNVQQSQKNFMR